MIGFLGVSPSFSTAHSRGCSVKLGKTLYLSTSRLILLSCLGTTEFSVDQFRPVCVKKVSVCEKRSRGLCVGIGVCHA